MKADLAKQFDFIENVKILDANFLNIAKNSSRHLRNLPYFYQKKKSVVTSGVL